MERVDLEACLRRAVRRDPDALTTLVELYSPRVFGLLYRLTGSRDVAEDLMQETFLRMVRTIDQYVHVGKFEPWLFRIAANLARDHARRVRRQGPPASWDSPGDDEPPPGAGGTVEDGPDDQLLRQEACQRLVAGLNRLSPAEREVLMLRHFSGMSFRDIAEALGVPLGTALARAHRALRRLRAELEDEAP